MPTWTPTTQQGDIYDWSRLLYGGGSATLPTGGQFGLTGNISDWGSRAGITMDPFQWAGPERHLVSGSGEGEVYSANPEFDQAAYDRALAEYEANPTFSAKRRTGDRAGWSDDNKYWYESTNYRLETGPDGQQYLVQAGDWTPQAEQSSWMQSGPDALRFLGVVGAGALGGGLFGGTGAAPVAAGGAMDMGAGGVLEAMGGGTGLLGGGTGVLTESMLAPFTPYEAAPLALSGTVPEATFLSTAGLPALAGSGGSGLLSGAGDLLRTPGIGRLIGTLGGGLLGGALSPDQSRPAINMSPRQSTTRAPTQHAYEPSQAMPNGLGSSSAGLFDDWMKQQLGGGRRTYHAPTFGGG